MLGLADDEILMHYRKEENELVHFEVYLFDNKKGAVRYQSSTTDTVIYVRLEQTDETLQIQFVKYITGKPLTIQEKENIRIAFEEVYKIYRHTEFKEVTLTF